MRSRETRRLVQLSTLAHVRSFFYGGLVLRCLGRELGDLGAEQGSYTCDQSQRQKDRNYNRR